MEQHLLGGANGPGAHAHAQGVCTAINETARLPAGDHVAADDLQVRVRPLDMRQHLQLVGGVPCTWMHALAARLPAHSYGAELVIMLASSAWPSGGALGNGAEVHPRLCMCLAQAAAHSESLRLLRYPGVCSEESRPEQLSFLNA